MSNDSFDPAYIWLLPIVIILVLSSCSVIAVMMISRGHIPEPGSPDNSGISHPLNESELLDFDGDGEEYPSIMYQDMPIELDQPIEINKDIHLTQRCFIGKDGEIICRNDDFSHPALKGEPPVEYTMTGGSDTCPSYVTPKIHIVDSCDDATHLKMRTIDWMNQETPEENPVTYMPGTTPPGYHEAIVHGLYEPDMNKNANLNAYFQYNTDPIDDGYMGHLDESYLIMPATSEKSIENQYKDVYTIN